MSSPIVEEVETHTGIRYEILRDITRDDLQVTKHPQKEIEEFSRTYNRVDAWITFWAEEAINALPDELKFSVCGKPFRSDRRLHLKDGVSFRKAVKYNGLRTDEAKLTKFNHLAAEVNELLEQKAEAEIDAKIEEANSALRERVDIKNGNWEKHTLEVYTSIERLNIDSVDKDAGTEEIHTEIEALSKEMEILEAKQAGLREALRKKRVAAMVLWVKKGDDDDDEEKTKSEATLSPIRAELIKALKEDSALKECALFPTLRKRRA